MVPASLFFIRSHAPTPEIDPLTWRLRVRGLVRRSLELSLSDLRQQFLRHDLAATLVCAGLRRDELVATLYAPPFRHRMNVPRARPVGFLRVAARLDDGSTAEDAMPLNASDLGSRIDVRLIQLAVVVTDTNGKPVPGLPKEAFRVRQNGEPQEIAAFENAGELPLTVALAIDSSASMFLKLPNVRRAVASLAGLLLFAFT